MKKAKNVEEYIAAAPIEVQLKLRQVRTAIRAVAPDAVESISYGMPFYSYKGEAGFKGRLVYFGLLKSNIALYMRPQDIELHIDEASEYKSTKSALQFLLDQDTRLTCPETGQGRDKEALYRRTKNEQKSKETKSGQVARLGVSEKSSLINQLISFNLSRA